MRNFLFFIAILFAVSCSSGNEFTLSNIPLDAASIQGSVWTITDDRASSKSDFERLSTVLKTNKTHRSIKIVFANLEEFPSNALAYAFSLYSEFSVDIVAPKAKKIGQNAFNGMLQLGSVSMPNVVIVGGRAFSGCDILSSVSLPKASYIPEYAFSQCRRLSNIKADNAEHVGPYGFMDCHSLVSLSLPSAIALHECGLSSCSKLKMVDLPKLQFVGRRAFECGSLEELSLPNVVTVEESGIGGCSSLLSLALPRVQTIGRSAFFGCFRLKELTIATGSKLERVGDVLFFNKDEVKKNVSLTLGKGVSKTGVGNLHDSNCWAGLRFKSITLK